MNIALPALVVFLTILPGFIIRSRLKRAERLSLDYSPFGQVVTEAVLWSFVAHGLWLLVAGLAFGRALRPEILLKLTSSDPVSQAHAAAEVAKQWWWICGYFASLLLVSYLLPTFARIAITHWRLDRYGHPLSRLLRFHGAPWYYLLTGADFEEDAKPDLISISTVVNISGSAYLYVGFLAEFFLDQNGQLDRLVLEQVIRRPLAADKATESAGRQSTQVAEAAIGSEEPAGAAADMWDRFYPVDGDCFVIRYNEATTLNIRYVTLAEVDS